MISRSSFLRTCLSCYRRAMENPARVRRDFQSAGLEVWNGRFRESLPRHRLQLVERKIHFQHVDPPLTQETELPSLDVLANELPHLIFTKAAFASEARHLELRCRWCDIRV